MKFVALLRGINVGNSVQVKMEDLKRIFESNQYRQVRTYIKSGNICFESHDDKTRIQQEIEDKLFEKYQVEIRVLVKTIDELNMIVSKIPKSWTNDDYQKTDVAFLFDENDATVLIDELPVKKEFINLIATPGAIVWNVTRENYINSRLNKIISHKKYKEMTVRNVNTARRLAEM